MIPDIDAEKVRHRETRNAGRRAAEQVSQTMGRVWAQFENDMVFNRRRDVVLAIRLKSVEAYARMVARSLAGQRFK